MANTGRRSAGTPRSAAQAWVWKVGVLVAAGVLSAGCTAGNRAVTSTPPAPAGAGSPGGSGQASPAASAPTAGATTPTEAGSRGAPPVVPPAGAGSAPAGAQSSPYLTTQDQTAETQDDSAIQQDLAQLNTELSTSDQNSSQGESDVPSN